MAKRIIYTKAMSTPVLLIKNFNSRYPGILGKLELYLQKEEKEKYWDDKFLMPMWILEKWMLENPDIMKRIRYDEEFLQAIPLIAWAKEAQILTIDQYLGEELLRTPIKGEEIIPESVFDNLPYYSSYVDLKKCSNEFDGFFYHFGPYIEKETGKSSYGIQLFVVKNDWETIGTIYYPDAGTLNKFFKKLHGDIDNSKINFDYEYHRHILSCLMPIIFYLSASNREMSENKEVKYVYKPKTNITMISEQNVKRWNVGTNLGCQFKRFKKIDEQIIKTGEYVKGSGCKKRPHLRRSHIHHFWIGPRNSPNRKLIYKILPPIAVNGGNSFANIAEHDVIAED